MSFEDFIEQDLDALNEDNEEDGIEPISFEDYIQMLEDDNFNVDPEGIGADGFIKDEYLREQFPDIYDNHYGTTTTLNADGTINKGNETITLRDRAKRFKQNIAQAKKFNKLLKSKYNKLGKGINKVGVDDLVDVLEEAPELLENIKHHYKEYVLPTYEYIKEDGYEKLEKLVKVVSTGASVYGFGKVMFNGIGKIRDKFRRPPPPDNNDNNDNNDDTQPPPPPPDMGGGGGGGGGDTRRRPTPPPPPPKEDEDKDEEPEPTTEFDTANIINELSTGISIPSASDISVSEPVVTNMPLTDRIYGVEIPRATSLMTAGVAMLGAVSASGLLTRRLPTPFQEQRYNDRLQRNYEESYADLQEQPATGIGADPRRLLEFEEASRNRNEDTLDLYRDRMRADIRSNTESRLTENRMREEIRSNTETRGLERRRLRESGRERDARQDLGEVIRNQAALRDELVDRQNMPQPVPADLSAHRGVSLEGRFARPPGRPPRNHKWNGETGKYERVLAPDQSTISSYFRVPPQEAIDPNIQEFVQAEDEAFDAEVENIGQELAELRTGMELTPPTEE